MSSYPRAPSATSSASRPSTPPLSKTQIQTFLSSGLLVVPHLSSDELQDALDGLDQTIRKYGVDPSTPSTLLETGHNLTELSSTNGSGGVLDIFYPSWKMSIALNKRLFQMTSQLWSETYCYSGEEFEQLDEEDRWKWHPFGSFDPSHGYAYIDRIGFRLPTDLAEKIGQHQETRFQKMVHNAVSVSRKEEETEERSGRKRRIRPIQRSLTPHLDCCPESYMSAEKKKKFRPIQCMVSLTDNLLPNTGGFEAVEGFHKKFDEWKNNRPPTLVTKKGKKQILEMPAPCSGEYTHIRPKEDSEVFSSIEHIPVRVGDAIFWDNRLPHANAYRHLGTKPRSVVYCSFLPDVEVNRVYVDKQLQDFLERRKPSDQWIELPPPSLEEGVKNVDHQVGAVEEEEIKDILEDDFKRKLIGLDSWQ